MGIFYTRKYNHNILRESDNIYDNYDSDGDEMYGIPETKSYPIYDKDSLIETILNFNNADSIYEYKLANKIIEKMKEYGVGYDIIDPNNNLRKYISYEELSSFNQPIKKESGGFFFTKEEEYRILNEVKVKDGNGNVVGGNDQLADDANKDTNDGFGTDPDGGYANRSAGGGGGGSADSEPEPQSDEPLPEDEPDAGEDEPLPDDETGGDDEPLPEDETGDAGDEPLPEDETEGGEGGEDEPLPEDEMESGDAGGGDAVGDIDASGGGGDDEPLPEDETDDGGDEGDSEEGDAEGEEGLDGNDLDGDIKEIEKELFSNINPTQMQEKKYHLKKDYMDLYEAVLRLINNLNKIPRNDDTQVVLDFLNKKSVELKELVSYNILHNYDNKSYIENTLTYQECLAVLNSISQILGELGIDLDKKNNEEPEEE